MKLQIQAGALLISTLGMIGSALGAGAPSVLDSLRVCAKKQDVLQRLSCYDAEMAKLDAPKSAASAPALAAPAAAASATASATRPVAPTPATLGSEQLRKAPAVPLGEEQVQKGPSLKFWQSKEPDANASMTARIDAVRTTPGGLVVITLDNGQVWRQMETEDEFPLAAGDTVRIDKAAMGSYRLRPVREGWKRSMRVTRSK